jgi:hypothetical protein
MPVHFYCLEYLFDILVSYRLMVVGKYCLHAAYWTLISGEWRPSKWSTITTDANYIVIANRSFAVAVLLYIRLLLI